MSATDEVREQMTLIRRQVDALRECAREKPNDTSAVYPACDRIVGSLRKMERSIVSAGAQPPSPERQPRQPGPPNDGPPLKVKHADSDQGRDQEVRPE